MIEGWLLNEMHTPVFVYGYIFPCLAAEITAASEQCTDSTVESKMVTRIQVNQSHNAGLFRGTKKDADEKKQHHVQCLPTRSLKLMSRTRNNVLLATGRKSSYGGKWTSMSCDISQSYNTSMWTCCFSLQDISLLIWEVLSVLMNGDNTAETQQPLRTKISWQVISSYSTPPRHGIPFWGNGLKEACSPGFTAHVCQTKKGEDCDISCLLPTVRHHTLAVSHWFTPSYMTLMKASCVTRPHKFEQ